MKIRNAVRMRLGTAATAIVLAAPVPALGQEAAPGAGADLGLEEIVVTARKRDESLIDVPVSITAFSETEIQSAGIARPQDFVALTPNMTMIQTQNQGTSFIVVRGISQARNSEPSVAVSIDGVLLSNPSAFNQELFDIQSIEVLKGPQGALYGRNAIGGAIIIRTREPSRDEIDGRVTLGYDSGPGFYARGGVGGPVADSETVRFMVSGSYYDTDGFIDNSYLGEEADPFKDLSGRARLIWDVSEDFTADFRVSASKTETQALYFNITEDVNDTSLDVRVNNRGVNERNMFGLSMKLDWETGVGTLTSITAYDTLDEILTGDQFNFLPVEESVLYAFFGADQAQHQWLDVSSVSQELRLTSPSDQRLRWITGVYAIATDRFISTGNVFDLSPFIPGWEVPQVKEDPLPYFDPQFSFLADEQDNLAWAVFGEIEYDISERLELAVALRYDRDDRENTTRTPDEFLPTDDAVSGEVRDETWDEWQPKLTLTYKASDELVVYGGYSRGFRSGGFNQTGVGAANIAGVNDLFDKEVADTFEAGAKALFLDRRLSVNGSLYYTEAEGSYFFVYDPNTGTQNLGNLDEVEYKGAELEFQAAAAEWLDLYARFGWTDSEIKKSSRDPDDVGNQAPLVSKYTVNLGAQFKGMLPFGEDLGWFIRPDYQIIGDTYWYPDNYTVRDPVNLLNLRAGVNGEAWTFTVWSRNLTDEEYNAEWSPGPLSFPSPGYTNNFVFKALPMVWGLELSYRF